VRVVVEEAVGRTGRVRVPAAARRTIEESLDEAYTHVEPDVARGLVAVEGGLEGREMCEGRGPVVVMIVLTRGLSAVEIGDGVSG
jgi:hypothetical protein